MRAVKKLTISAICVALGVAFMSLGAVFGVLDLTSAVFASLLVALIYVECGSPYTYLTWLATSVLTFIFFPGHLMWLIYFLVFGIYPILKGYIERLPRLAWLILKLVYLNGMMTVMFFFAELVTGVPFLGSPAEIPWLPPVLFYVFIWIFLNLAFILYDKMIVIMLLFYEKKIRPKISRYLK